MRHAVAVLEKAFDLGDLQRIPDAVVHAGKRQRMSFFLMANISSHQRADPGRIDVRDACEIQYKPHSDIRANQVLKLVQRRNGERTREFENAFLVLDAEILDRQWFIAHKFRILPGVFGLSMATDEF